MKGAHISKRKYALMRKSDGSKMNGTQVRVINGLHAYFKQASGPSRPGHDWIVLLSGASDERKILTRTYDDDAPGMTVEQHAKRAIDYIVSLHNAGTLPPHEPGNPAFVIVPRPD